MSTGRGRHRRRPRTIAVLLGLVAVGALAVPIAGALTDEAVEPAGAATTAPDRPVSPPDPNSGSAAPVTPAPVAAPTVAPAAPQRITIGRIGVDAAVETVGTTAEGTLEPPVDPAQTGWYRESSAPGDLGPSVLVGHLDSRQGPGVFVRLGELRPGDEVEVTDAAGAVRRFAVTVVDSFAKEQFPSERVYGATPQAELRLVTCGGEYVRGTGYAENLIVEAVAL